MLSLTLWTVVSLVVTGAAALVLQLGESAWSGGLLAPPRGRVLTVAASLGVLVALTLLLKVRAVAEIDGDVVERLAASRGDALTQLMTYVTTMGDAIPTFTIGALLALVIHRQGVHRVACWALPVLVLVELAIQVVVGDVLHPLDIADVAPTLHVGGEGYIPSGSVARLSSLVLVGALMLRSSDLLASRRLMTWGAVAIVLEAVSRLYLGRHFILDVLGGLALGLALFAAFSLCLRSVRTPSSADPATA